MTDSVVMLPYDVKTTKTKRVCAELCHSRRLCTPRVCRCLLRQRPGATCPRDQGSCARDAAAAKRCAWSSGQATLSVSAAWGEMNSPAATAVAHVLPPLYLDCAFTPQTSARGLAPSARAPKTASRPTRARPRLTTAPPPGHRPPSSARILSSMSRTRPSLVCGRHVHSAIAPSAAWRRVASLRALRSSS